MVLFSLTLVIICLIAILYLVTKRSAGVEILKYGSSDLFVAAISKRFSSVSSTEIVGGIKGTFVRLHYLPAFVVGCLKRGEKGSIRLFLPNPSDPNLVSLLLRNRNEIAKDVETKQDVITNLLFNILFYLYLKHSLLRPSKFDIVLFLTREHSFLRFEKLGSEVIVTEPGTNGEGYVAKPSIGGGFVKALEAHLASLRMSSVQLMIADEYLSQVNWIYFESALEKADFDQFCEFLKNTSQLVVPYPSGGAKLNLGESFQHLDRSAFMRIQPHEVIARFKQAVGV